MSRGPSTVELPPAALARLAALGVEPHPRSERRALRARAVCAIERLVGGCLLYRLDFERFGARGDRSALEGVACMRRGRVATSNAPIAKPSARDAALTAQKRGSHGDA
jgi:hypothetical protein